MERSTRGCRERERTSDGPPPRAECLLLLATLLALALTAPPARAGVSERPIEIGFADPDFDSPDGAKRVDLMDRAVGAGSQYMRIIISWRFIAATEPAQPTNPDDRAYNFRRLDLIVKEASERGLDVLFTLHAAPDWATDPDAVAGGDYPGTPETRNPDPVALGQFAAALALRYSGHYEPPPRIGIPTTGPLPRVHLFEPWNEPNLTGFLSPQWIGNTTYSPELYRRLLNSVYDAVHFIQPDATVIAGATAPEGDLKGPARRISPLKFIRELLCLRDRRELRAAPCPEPARFDVLSHHPITPERPPRRPARQRDNAGIVEMGEIHRILRAAEVQGTVYPAGLRRDVWATEFWWETNPPTPTGFYEAPSERRQARNIADALRLLWKERVEVALLFQVRDSADVTGPPREGWATGILFADDTRKESYRSVRVPFVADRVSRKRVSTWTRVPEAGRLDLVVKQGGRSETVARIDVAAGDVVTRRVKLRGSASMVARIAGERSNAWPVKAKPDPR